MRQKRVETQPEGNEGAALADARGAVGKTKLVRLPLAFIEFIIKSYVITESKCFQLNEKKIGKFRTRRFQQVKIFSLQILCLIVFTNPNPFEKKEKNVFIYCWCLFDGFYFSILFLININSLPFSETSRRSSRSISNGNNSIGHGSCRSGCCSRRRRIKQKIPAEVGVMPCEIPVKRSGKVLLPRFSLQGY